MTATRLILAVSLSAASLLACGGKAGPSNHFAANMTADAETPAPAGVTATATGSVTFNGPTATYTITYTGLSGPPSAAHIHLGAPGVAGGVVVPFSNLPTTTAGTISGTFTVADIKVQTTPPVATLDDLLGQLRSGNGYLNLHSTANKGGEIRGQLVAQ